MLGSMFGVIKGGIGAIPVIGNVIQSAGPLQDVIAALVTGSVAAAGGVAGCYVLTLPVVRQSVGGICFAGGKVASLLFIRWFGAKWGGKIEDRIQSFLNDIVVTSFMKGLDSDDHLSREN